jgi:hypothetical protein
MRAGCAASSFFQFLVGYGENEKVGGVISSVEMLVHGNGSCPAPSHFTSTALNTTRTHVLGPRRGCSSSGRFAILTANRRASMFMFAGVWPAHNQEHLSIVVV